MKVLIKNIIQQIESFFETLVSIGRILLKTNLKHRIIFNGVADKPSLIVLGNGPSLTEVFEEDYLARLVNSGGEFFCVNTFCFSDQYSSVKPRYYLLLDPEFWEETATEQSKAMRRNLFEKINTYTDWEMTFYLPWEAEKTQFFLNNNFRENIKIKYFNNVSFQGYEWIKFLLYRLGVCMPLPQNVLIGALYLGINLGYKDIILLGADMSLHKNVVLDKKNVVCGEVKRFFDNELIGVELVPFLKQGSDPFWRMGDLFQAFADTFNTFYELQDYVDKIGINVKNASSITYIDAFPRYDLKDIVRLDEK